MTFSETIVYYSHTIKTGYMEDPSCVRALKGGGVVYDGIAVSVVDETSVLFFVDKNGKSRKIQKIITY